jgi:hypothetical protein
MVWNNGVSDYMNAYNVFWNDGTGEMETEWIIFQHK